MADPDPNSDPGSGSYATGRDASASATADAGAGTSGRHSVACSLDEQNTTSSIPIQSQLQAPATADDADDWAPFRGQDVAHDAMLRVFYTNAGHAYN